MPNEQTENNVTQPNMAAPIEGSETAPAPAPTDLAEAFAQLRQADKAAADNSVASVEDDGEPVGKHAKATEPSTEAAAPESTDEGGYAQASTPDVSPQSGQSDNMGGNAVSNEPVDYTPARQQIYQGVNQQAIQNVAQRFQSNNIRMWEISDLYQKDERSGRVTFANPDDEDRPFQSRKEAQDFVDAMNKQIDAKFRQEVRAEQQRLLQAAQPSLSMLDFVPVYQGMSATERGVFDELITPYAVRDAQNNIVGFNINLNAAAEQARKIASRFASAQPQQTQQTQAKQKEEPASAPAMDMASGTGEAASEEPKDLSEAFEMLKKKNKEEKKNG